MERRQQMDTPCFASTRRQVKIDMIVQDIFELISILNNRVNAVYFLRKAPVVITLLILAFSSLPLRAQPSLSDHTTEIKQLFAEERWEEIVRIAEVEAERSA